MPPPPPVSFDVSARAELNSADPPLLLSSSSLIQRLAFVSSRASPPRVRRCNALALALRRRRWSRSLAHGHQQATRFAIACRSALARSLAFRRPTMPRASFVRTVAAALRACIRRNPTFHRRAKTPLTREAIVVAAEVILARLKATPELHHHR